MSTEISEPKWDFWKVLELTGNSVPPDEFERYIPKKLGVLVEAWGLLETRKTHRKLAAAIRVFDYPPVLIMNGDLSPGQWKRTMQLCAPVIHMLLERKPVRACPMCGEVCDSPKMAKEHWMDWMNRDRCPARLKEIGILILDRGCGAPSVHDIAPPPPAPKRKRSRQ